MEEAEYIAETLKLARTNIDSGKGGPFGALIVKDGNIIARAANSVTIKNDPTAHAEIEAIRKACEELNTFDLSGCILYASCEPCPMCFSAIYWAHIDRVYFASNKDKAAEAGFDDQYIYDQLQQKAELRAVPMAEVKHPDAGREFILWNESGNKIPY